VVEKGDRSILGRGVRRGKGLSEAVIAVQFPGPVLPQLGFDPEGLLGQSGRRPSKTLTQHGSGPKFIKSAPRILKPGRFFRKTLKKSEVRTTAEPPVGCPPIPSRGVGFPLQSLISGPVADGSDPPERKTPFRSTWSTVQQTGFGGAVEGAGASARRVIRGLVQAASAPSTDDSDRIRRETVKGDQRNRTHKNPSIKTQSRRHPEWPTPVPPNRLASN
jgi:hypothetical protein